MSITAARKWFGVELVEVSSTEKLIASLGGGLSILILAGISHWILPGSGAAGIIASMGASAVLLFAVPHGQLSQPWPILAGHGISAIIGVGCAHCIPQPAVAAACAVGLAIGAMHQLKCIHPPGGATAFTAAMGGPAVQQLGFWFVLTPVLTNAAMLVLLAVLMGRAFRWRHYPAGLVPTMQAPLLQKGSPTPSHEDVVAALKSFDSFVDINEEDLLRLADLLSHREKSTK